MVENVLHVEINIHRHTQHTKINMVAGEVKLVRITVCSCSDDVLMRIPYDELDSGFVMRMREIEI